MFRTAVVTSEEVNARVASHFSKVPSMSTDAFTPNLILLSTGVILKTGMAAVSCGWVADANRENAKRQKIVSRMLESVSFSRRLVNEKACLLRKKKLSLSDFFKHLRPAWGSFLK